MKKKIDTFDVVNIILLFFVLMIVIFPIIYVVLCSLSKTGSVSFSLSNYNLDSYINILSSSKVPRAFKNSVIYTLTGTFLGLFLVTITAYPLADKQLKGRNFLLRMIAFTMFFNGGLIPIFLLINSLGFMDSIWAIIVPWAVPAYELMLLRNYFESIPSEMHEAAEMDGASEYHILFKIYIPMALPMLCTLALFFARGQWNSYLVPLMYLSSAKRFPLQVILQEMLIQDTAKSTGDALVGASIATESLKNATIVISMIPLVLMYPLFQKYFISGIYVGAVKG
ncbi:MAG: carbohydrate ABC transporter permease [Clostridia bacterium]|nr:carbohydrate ABC transporter permease [Clostridia bacterium]